MNQKCLRVKDAELNFFRTNTQIIKSAFHQESNITEPGKYLQIFSTAFLITTHLINPFQKVTCEEGALKRRFLQIPFDSTFEPDINYCDLNKRNEFLRELVKNIATRNSLNTDFNIESSASKNKTR